MLFLKKKNKTKKEQQHGYQYKMYLVIGRDVLLCQKPFKYNNKYNQNEIIHFLMGNIFVQFGGLVFQQAFGITLGTKCAQLLQLSLK